MVSIFHDRKRYENNIVFSFIFIIDDDEDEEPDEEEDDGIYKTNIFSNVNLFYLGHGHHHHHHAGGRGGHHHGGGGKHGSSGGAGGVSILFIFRSKIISFSFEQKSRGGKQGSSGGPNGGGQQPECKQQ